MDNTAERMREAMRIRGLKQADIVERTGIGKSSISTYLTGEYAPKQKNLYRIAAALSVSPAWLMGYDVKMEQDISSPTSFPGLTPITSHRLPILGPVAAGIPIVAEREYDEYVDVPVDTDERADAALRIEGDSMEPKYLDNDIVLIRYQDDVDDGQIAAVCIDDYVTLKRVYHVKNGVCLVSENKKYPPMTFTLEDADNIHIAGLAVGFVRWEE